MVSIAATTAEKTAETGVACSTCHPRTDTGEVGTAMLRDSRAANHVRAWSAFRITRGG
jgi:hypothetical protein